MRQFLTSITHKEFLQTPILDKRAIVNSSKTAISSILELKKLKEPSSFPFHALHFLKGKNYIHFLHHQIIIILNNYSIKNFKDATHKLTSNLSFNNNNN